MTNNFTASNGDTIETRPDGWLVVRDGHHAEWVSPLTVDALREYFQHRRDAELGRWRDEETGLLIYPAGTMTAGTNSEYRAVQVLDETLPYFTLIHEGDLTSKRRRRAEREEVQAAARYFAAHPEPKPWESAEEGEMWLITCGTGYKNTPAIVKDGKFYFPNRYGEGLDFIDLAAVMTATRLYAEESGDE